MLIKNRMSGVDGFLKPILKHFIYFLADRTNLLIIQNLDESIDDFIKSIKQHCYLEIDIIQEKEQMNEQIQSDPRCNDENR